MIEIIAFSGSFADACKNGVTTVSLGDVIDEFLNKDGFAHASTAEKSDLTASGVRSQQIDDLNASNQQLGSGSLVRKAGRITMDRVF